MNENNLTVEHVLEQSLELNRIQAEVIKEKGKNQRLPLIMAIVAFASAVLIVGSLLFFFSQYEFYTETITVTQDTAAGGGNNIYQEGAYAQYHEALEAENGEANGNQAP